MTADPHLTLYDLIMYGDPTQDGLQFDGLLSSSYTEDVPMWTGWTPCQSFATPDWVALHHTAPAPPIHVPVWSPRPTLLDSASQRVLHDIVPDVVDSGTGFFVPLADAYGTATKGYEDYLQRLKIEAFGIPARYLAGL